MASAGVGVGNKLLVKFNGGGHIVCTAYTDWIEEIDTDDNTLLQYVGIVIDPANVEEFSDVDVNNNSIVNSTDIVTGTSIPGNDIEIPYTSIKYIVEITNPNA